MTIKIGDLALWERKIIEIEYELDALVVHCQRKKCSCVGPLALKRLTRIRNVSRGLRDRIRNANGQKQKTLTDPSGCKWRDQSLNHVGWGKGLIRNYDCKYIPNPDRLSIMSMPVGMRDNLDRSTFNF